MVLVRFASPADADGVAAVRRSSWPAAYTGLIPPAVIEVADGVQTGSLYEAGTQADTENQPPVNGEYLLTPGWAASQAGSTGGHQNLVNLLARILRRIHKIE